jgi:hypothetical protein
MGAGGHRRPLFARQEKSFDFYISIIAIFCDVVKLPKKTTMTAKDILAKIPYSADLYDALRPVRPRTRYNLSQLETAINGLYRGRVPDRVFTDRNGFFKPVTGKKIIIFANLHYWIEQAVIVGLALRGMGHDVTIAYLPYGDWDKPINGFDLRRQDLYTRRVLSPLKGWVKAVSLLDVGRVGGAVPPYRDPAHRQKIASSPKEQLLAHRPDVPTGMTTWIRETVETASAFDVMYTLQVEDFERDSDLYRLRVARNESAALAAMRLLQAQCPETVLIPNGLVTELGIFYQVARHLDVMTVTYEFNDQREQIWLAQNDVVMRQNTDALWAAKGGAPLTNAEREKIAALEDARTSAKKYGKGTRFWQDVASVGGEKLRADLGLDARPMALLATNVLGDSLTLGRNVFTASMAEWIAKTVQYFAARTDVQLVVRIHPGERLMKGPSSLGVIHAAVPQMPGHIKLIGPDEKVNTYDLMELAGLGLAYTTTVGMEMAMRGAPVILAGQTHYRGRGFTYEPATYDEYFGLLDKLLTNLPGYRLTPEQVETAWNYAYRFFFEFPLAFPWRLMKFWQDLDTWPLSRVLSDEGRAEFGRAFDYLAGEPVKWNQ